MSDESKNTAVKPEKPKYKMSKCVGYMISLAWKEKEKKVIFISLALAALAVAQNLINLFIAPTILGAVERQASAGELIIAVLAFTGLLILVSALTAYAEANKLYGRVTVRCALMSRVNDKLCTTSYQNTIDGRFRDLFAKSTQTFSSNSSATEAVWDTLTAILRDISGFIIYLFILSNVDVRLLIFITVTAAAGYFLSIKLNEYGFRHREELGRIFKPVSHINLTVRQNGYAKDIRIFGLKPWISELMDKSLSAFRAFHIKKRKVYIWAEIADIVLAFLRNGVAYVYLISLVLNGEISVSAFLLYFSAVGGFTEWISGILKGFSELHRQCIDISTDIEVINYPEPFKFEEGENIPESNGKYEIELKNVSYKYPEAEDYTLIDINLTLHAGEKLAVVGVNGAGKTTLVKLLCGFLDPTEGIVTVNGKNVKSLNRREYYKLFSAVFQKFATLPCTVAANVAQTEENIDMNRVRSCIERAGLTDKIESLENKYETKLNRSVHEDAAELSGGEQQRLMLARALYRNAPVIVLDEPTAALDPIAEADLYSKYNDMTKGRSSVYISHRLASTRFCDRIILIDGSRIAEVGTHDELLKRGGKYAEMFSVQSKYYKEN